MKSHVAEKALLYLRPKVETLTRLNSDDSIDNPVVPER